MPEYRTFKRGRRFLSFHEAENRAAITLGEQPPHEPKLSFFRRLFATVWLVLRLGRTPTPAPLPPPNPNRIWWAGLFLPEAEVGGHAAIIGSTGSGKTVTIESLEETILQKIRPGSDRRAVIFDAKREKYSRLMNLNLAVPVLLWDPMDSRAVAWDIAADIKTPADARQIAAGLIREGKSDNDRFWLKATRNVLGGVLWVFAVHCPGRWTLHDVLLVMRYPNRISFVLRLLPETAHLWSAEYRDERTVSNLIESFHSFLQDYETVATLWLHSEKKLSLREWVKSESVLLIRTHPRFAAILQPIQQTMLDLLFDLLLSNPDSRTRRSWFELDEVAELPKLRNLLKAMNLGRSKGISILLGLQAIESFVTLYDENEAKAILGQCRNKTFLRTDSHETAEYAAKHFGEVQWLITKVTESQSHSANGGSTRSSSVDHSTSREPVLMTSEFMGIAPPSETQPVVMFNDVPSIGCFAASIPLQNILDCLTPPNLRIPNVVDAPDEWQRCPEWKRSDLKRLKLPLEMLRIPSELPELLLGQLKTLEAD